MIDNTSEDFFDIENGFLQNPPVLPVLPELKKETFEDGEIPATLLEPVHIPHYIRVAGVRFGTYGRVYDYLVGEASLKVDDAIVADFSDKGVVMGWIAKAPIKFDNSELKIPFRTIMRIATKDDIEKYQRCKLAEDSGLMTVKKHVSRLNLHMQTLRVEFSLDMRKAVVYFASEARVDFRELLKELVHDLKAKVELRQVGVRDQAKLLGGIGPCGEELCCSKHLNKFHAVNIKMAKDQNLSLKPTKVSGVCGRLKCCLQYEQDAYRDALKGLPHIGKKVKCDKGCGVVSEVDVLKQMVTVLFDDGVKMKVPVNDVISEATIKSEVTSKNEKMVATSDTQGLVAQIMQKRNQTENDEKKTD